MSPWPVMSGEESVRWTPPDPQAEWLWPRAYGRLGVPLRQVGPRGRYALQGILNQGGQGVLWAALDIDDGYALVVVKTVRPDLEHPGASTGPSAAGARLTREARLLEWLGGCRQVMPLLGWGPGRVRGEGDDGEFETEHPWLVLPYRAHLRLGEALARHSGSLGADGARGLGGDLASGLEYLHVRGGAPGSVAGQRVADPVGGVDHGSGDGVGCGSGRRGG